MSVYNADSLQQLLDENYLEQSSKFSPIDKIRLREYLAVAAIYDKWLSHRNRKTFTILKHSVIAAESSLSNEVLRKVNPFEAELLNDKVFKYRIRFRLGGEEFPPSVYYKVFLQNDSSVTYVCGKHMIQSNSEAAEDSLRQMGSRSYYDKIIRDNLYNAQYKVTDLVDVSTLKDYILFYSNLDETPAQLGGRDNCWRKLTLEDIPRRCVFRDIIEYLDNRNSLSHILNTYPELLKKPNTQDVKLLHIRIISNFKDSESRASPDGYFMKHSHVMNEESTGSNATRRSKKALERTHKMKNTYLSRSPVNSQATKATTAELNEDWERDASKLYEWTQSLSCDDNSSNVDFML